MAPTISRSVLWVQPYPDLRGPIADLLEQAGCTVAVASTFGEALAALRAYSVDLVVTDYELDGFTGLRLAVEASCSGRLSGGMALLLSPPSADSVFWELRSAGVLKKPRDETPEGRVAAIVRRAFATALDVALVEVEGLCRSSDPRLALSLRLHPGQAASAKALGKLLSVLHGYEPGHVSLEIKDGAEASPALVRRAPGPSEILHGDEIAAGLGRWLDDAGVRRRSER